MREPENDGAISLVLKIKCAVEKQLTQAANKAKQQAERQFGTVGKAIEQSMAAPVRGIDQAMNRSLESAKAKLKASEGDFKRSGEAVGAALSRPVQSMAQTVDGAVERAKLKVREVERELETVNSKLDQMRASEQSRLSSFYSGKGLTNAVDSSMAKNKDYQKLLAQSDTVNRRLMAAEDKLSLAKVLAAQKTAAKQKAIREKSAAQAARIAQKERLAVGESEQGKVADTQKAEALKAVRKEKTQAALSALGSKAASMAASVGSAIVGKIKGALSKITQRIKRFARTLKSVFKAVFVTAAIYTAFRSIKDVVGKMLTQNKELMRSLQQIKGNLAAAFQPIIQFVMPAITALVQGLAYLTKKVAEFMSAFFGTTYKESLSAIKQLQGVQKEAKKTASLAAIDEINNLAQPESNSEGGFDWGAIEGQYGDPDVLIKNFEDTFKRLADKIPELFAEVLKRIADNMPRIVDVAVEFIKTFLQSLHDHWPEIREAGLKIMKELLRGLKDIIPELAQFAVDLIILLAEALIDAAPDLFDAGIEMIGQVLKGIEKELPNLIPKAQQAVMHMVNTLRDKGPEILNSGITIMLTLLRGISDMMPTLIPTVIEIVLSFIQTIVDRLPEIIQTAVLMISNFAQGIINSVPKVVKAAPGIIQGLISGMMGAIPTLLTGAGEIVEALINMIKETDWVQVGKDILNAIKNGFLEGWNKIKDWFNGLFGGKESSPPPTSSWKSTPSYLGKGTYSSFASGGIIKKPQLAMVGDNKRSPEAVAPLHELYGMIRKAVSSSTPRQMYGESMEINLRIGDDKIATWFVNSNKQVERKAVGGGTGL